MRYGLKIATIFAVVSTVLFGIVILIAKVLLEGTARFFWPDSSKLLFWGDLLLVLGVSDD